MISSWYLLVDRVGERRQADRVETQIQQDLVRGDIARRRASAVPSRSATARSAATRAALRLVHRPPAPARRDRTKRATRRQRALGFFLSPHASSTFSCTPSSTANCAPFRRQTSHERVQARRRAQRLDAQRLFEEALGLLVELHAAVGPERPVDAQRLPGSRAFGSQALALGGKRVHEVIGEAVIALPGIAGRRPRARRT